MSIYDLSAYKNPLIIWTGGSFSPPTIGHISVANIVANYIYKMFNTNRNVILYFVPVSKKYAKESVLNNTIGEDSDNTRLMLLNICSDYLNKINSNIKFFVSDLEIIERRSVPTIESIEILKQNIRHASKIPIPDESFFISLGQDNVEGILSGKWSKPFTLLEKNIICVPRPTSELNKTINITSKLLESVNISKLLDKEKMDPIPEPKDLIDKIIIVEDTIPESITNASSTKLRTKLKEYYQGNQTAYQILKDMTLPQIIDFIIDNNLYKNFLLKQKGGTKKYRINRNKKKNKSKTRRK